jgi:hypothetical protein
MTVEDAKTPLELPIAKTGVAHLKAKIDAVCRKMLKIVLKCQVNTALFLYSDL